MRNTHVGLRKYVVPGWAFEEALMCGRQATRVGKEHVVCAAAYAIAYDQ